MKRSFKFHTAIQFLFKFSNNFKKNNDKQGEASSSTECKQKISNIRKEIFPDLQPTKVTFRGGVRNKI